MSQAKPILGSARLDRFPLVRPPSLHPNCAAAEGDFGEPVTSDSSSTECLSGVSASNPREGHVRAQVQQLQFWLKVFSRFCQEDDSALE